MLCDKCSNIHFKRLEDCEIIKQEPDRLRGDEGRFSNCLFYIHHKSKRDLQKSSDRGCHFCAALLNRVAHFKDLQGSSYYFGRGELILCRSIVRSWIEEDNGLEEWNRSDWIYIDCGTKSWTTKSVEKYSGLVTETLEALTTCTNLESSGASGRTPYNTVTPVPLGGWEKLEDDLAPSRNPRIYSPWLDTTTASPANIVLASVWLKNCLQTHRPCQNSQKQHTLPSRIIDISDPRHPFLDEGRGRETEYVTLSYKWGESRRFVTTTQTLSRYSKEIPFQDLPWTFKEAICVASTLGFRFLWIDALCIIQDSKKDQEREIGLMDQIFQNSVLTLFAAAGNNTDAGLSVTRDPRWIKPCQLELKSTIEGKTISGRSYVTLDGGDQFEPLFTRGWVLQEQVLATRGLVFGGRELVWRCLCGSSTESFPSYTSQVGNLQELGHVQYNKWRTYSTGWDGFDLLRMWLQSQNPVPDRTPWQRENQFDHWYRLVKIYCTRSLTYSSDILPALAGLASAMAKTHSCTYVAGLWKEDLQIGLAWYVVKDDDSHGSEEQNEPLPDSTLNLPSWSWVSQWGKVVDFRGWESNNTQVKHEGVSLANDSEHGQSSGPAPFDSGIDKSLKLTGLFRMAIVDQLPKWQQNIEHNDMESGRWISNIKDPVSGKTIGQIALDCNPESVRVQTIHCLLCTVREKYGKWHLTCLGLAPAAGLKDEFTRVGLVFLRQVDWFGELDLYDSKVHHWAQTTPKDTSHIRTIRVV